VFTDCWKNATRLQPRASLTRAVSTIDALLLVKITGVVFLAVLLVACVVRVRRGRASASAALGGTLVPLFGGAVVPPREAHTIEEAKESKDILRASRCQGNFHVQRLKQAVRGQLGQLTRRLAEAGINIEALYSDHDHQLVLVVDQIERAREVSAAWAREA
jgi:hypothetical protein